MRTRYPPIEPFRIGFLQQAEHRIYWEESGNPRGLPVIFLHGGPGSCTDPSHRCFFDPAVYRIVLMDQRGSGKSTPHAELSNNTTWHLVADIEKLREHLKIEKWVVFGGSWGSTLGLAYAETHPARVKGLILRGIFLCRKKDLRWFYQGGANYIYPDEWEKFVEPIPGEERGEMIQAYYRRLTDSDPKVRQAAAAAWSGWEGATLKLVFDPATFSQFIAPIHAEAIARIECHYFVNDCFFLNDNWLIEHADAIRRIPTVLIHGRYDVICPLEGAWDLHKALPQAKLEIVKDAGHSASEPGITDALVRAADAFGKGLAV